MSFASEQHAATRPLTQWRFHTGARGWGVQAPQIVARPPNLAVLLTHCGQLIL